MSLPNLKDPMKYEAYLTRSYSKLVCVAINTGKLVTTIGDLESLIFPESSLVKAITILANRVVKHDEYKLFELPELTEDFSQHSLVDLMTRLGEKRLTNHHADKTVAAAYIIVHLVRELREQVTSCNFTVDKNEIQRKINCLIYCLNGKVVARSYLINEVVKFARELYPKFDDLSDLDLLLACGVDQNVLDKFLKLPSRYSSSATNEIESKPELDSNGIKYSLGRVDLRHYDELNFNPLKIESNKTI
jgi:hypothetical protein